MSRTVSIDFHDQRGPPTKKSSLVSFLSRLFLLLHHLFRHLAAVASLTLALCFLPIQFMSQSTPPAVSSVCSGDVTLANQFNGFPATFSTTTAISAKVRKVLWNLTRPYLLHSLRSILDTFERLDQSTEVAEEPIEMCRFRSNTTGKAVCASEEPAAAAKEAGNRPSEESSPPAQESRQDVEPVKAAERVNTITIGAVLDPVLSDMPEVSETIETKICDAPSYAYSASDEEGTNERVLHEEPRFWTDMAPANKQATVLSMNNLQAVSGPFWTNMAPVNKQVTLPATLPTTPPETRLLSTETKGSPPEATAFLPETDILLREKTIPLIETKTPLPVLIPCGCDEPAKHTLSRKSTNRQGIDEEAADTLKSTGNRPISSRSSSRASSPQKIDRSTGCQACTRHHMRRASADPKVEATKPQAQSWTTETLKKLKPKRMKSFPPGSKGSQVIRRF